MVGVPLFLELAFEAEVADLLADLTALHEADDPLSEGDRNEQRQETASAERNEMYWNMPAPGRS